MNRIYRLLFITVLMFYSWTTMAQEWRSILYPADWVPPVDKNFYRDTVLQDFSYAGYHRGEKSIPQVESNILNVSAAAYGADNTGVKDVTSILQQAIDDAARKGGGVVYLPAGTYKISPQGGQAYALKISNSNIVLRGDGPGKTFLYNSSSAMREKSIILVEKPGSWNTGGKNNTRITRDLMMPATAIPVQSVAGYRTGDLVIVRNTITEGWIRDHKMEDYWMEYRNKLPGITYIREILAVNAATNELVIDIPIRYALKTSDEARIYKAPEMLHEVGIEHLSIGNRQSFVPTGWQEEDYRAAGNGAYDAHDSYAINFNNGVNSWIRNVASYQPAENTSGTHILSNGIRINESKNITVEDCYFKNPQFGGGGGNGYMYRIMANETLIKNCVAEFQRHGFVLSHMMASGNVFYRCTDLDAGNQRGISGHEQTIGSGSDHHMHFSHSNLFDQCGVENSHLDARFRPWGDKPLHGLTAAHTVFWNTTSNGVQSHAVKTQQGRLGYAIGTTGLKSDVLTTAQHPGTEPITDPVDHVEGVGKGNSLLPQSLFSDQLRKRLQALDKDARGKLPTNK
jgi:hypothetical protein